MVLVGRSSILTTPLVEVNSLCPVSAGEGLTVLLLLVVSIGRGLMIDKVLRCSSEFGEGIFTPIHFPCLQVNFPFDVIRVFKFLQACIEYLNWFSLRILLTTKSTLTEVLSALGHVYIRSAYSQVMNPPVKQEQVLRLSPKHLLQSAFPIKHITSRVA